MMEVMRVLLYMFLIILGFSGNVFGQKPFQILLPKPYESNEELGIVPLRNGDFVTLESIPGFYLITYFNRCHNIMWSTSIPNTTYTNCEACAKLISTPDTSFIIAHTLKDKNISPIITKINKNGKLVWSKRLFINNFPSLNMPGAYSLIATDDGGLFHVSNNYDPLTGHEILLSRIDANGNIIWSKSFGQSIASGKILTMPDKGVCLISLIPFGNSTIQRIDSSGNTVWFKELRNVNTSYSNYISVSASDANGNIFCLAGSCVLQIDKNGLFKYACNINPNYWAVNIAVNTTGNIIIGGVFDKYAALASLDIISSRLNILSSIENVHVDDYLINTPDIGFITLTDGYFITKTDSLGRLGCKKQDTSLEVTPVTYSLMPISPTATSDGYKSQDTILITHPYNQKVKMLCGKEYYPISDLGEDVVVCKDTSYILKAVNNTGYRNKNLWSTGDTTEKITVTKSGKYWLAISSAYCTNTDTVNIIFRDEIKSNLQDKFICPYDSVLVQSPKVKAANFYWINPDKSIFRQSDIWAKDTGTYYLMLEGNTNCKNIDTFRLQHYHLPKSSAGPDTTLCYNQVYEMQGKGGITYKWIPSKYLSNDTISNPLAKAPEQQLYMLIVKNAFGCADTSQMWLKVKPKLEVKLQAVNNSICSGEAIQLQAKASGGDSLHYIYKWQNSATKDSTFNTTLQKSGWLKVKLEDGCSEPTSDSIFITVKPTPIAAFYTDPKDTSLAENKIQFINQSQHATNYEWLFGTGAKSKLQNPTYIYTDTGKYFITLIAQNTNGCSDTAYGQIYIQEKFRIFIPNTFTPDDDLNNDVFSVFGTGIKEYSYEIYNRWGERIFTSNNTNKQSWNGAIENRGEVVQMDVYFYVLKVTDLEHRDHYFNGTINLLR